jgi:hypothetical protein
MRRRMIAALARIRADGGAKLLDDTHERDGGEQCEAETDQAAAAAEAGAQVPMPAGAHAAVPAR